jgi:predicted dehydrogenase
VIGVGHFGRRHAEKYAAIEGADLIAVADADAGRAAEVAAACGTTAVTDYRELFGKVEAVSLAVPTSRHHAVARDCLEAGLHVLVEKPLADKVDDANDLIEIAEARGLILQVGHLERFSPAYFAMADRVSKPLYIEANRISPFNPRVIDVSVVLDLMIHDIDLIMALVGEPVLRVDAIGAPVVSKHEDIVNTRVTFASGCVANLTASRVSLKTERTMRIFEPACYIQADLVARKVVVRSKGEGEMFPGIPNIAQDEHVFDEADALMLEVEAFIKSVRTGERPRVDGVAGRDAVQAAMMITDSLRAHRRMLEQAGTI